MTDDPLAGLRVWITGLIDERVDERVDERMAANHDRLLEEAIADLARIVSEPAEAAA